MNRKTLAAMLLALAAWAFPLHAASAIKERNVIDSQTINYEYFRTIKIQTAGAEVTAVVKNPKSAKLNFKAPKAPVPPPQGTYNGRHYSKEEVEALIVQYSQQYGISHDLPRRIAYCESGYNQFSKNRSSSASGVFQYLTGTFRNTSEGKQGLSPFDADANVRAAVRHIATHGTAPWNASKHCWNRLTN